MIKKLILTAAFLTLFSCGSVPSTQPVKQYEIQVLYRNGVSEILRFESRFLLFRQGDLIVSDDKIGELNLVSDVRQFNILDSHEK